ncbi:MAG: STAS domain-containing protein [Candidatus Eremiobacteraeota bacterium]|nr:STAS domain-containing protein [Candidatus Eremiobacteraeota bacterium]
MAVILTFTGEYDLAAREALRAEFDALLGVADVVVDLTGVAYIDSTIVTEFLVAKRKREDAGKRPIVFVVKESGAVRRIVELSFLDKVFPIVTRLDDAVRPGLDYETREAFPGTPPSKIGL